MGTMLKAKALYNNIAETQEELSFAQGDILTVVEKDVGGITGWWLCTLKDRTGIAPGNRLKLLACSAVPDPDNKKIYRGSPAAPPSVTSAPGDGGKLTHHQADKVGSFIDCLCG